LEPLDAYDSGIRSDVHEALARMAMEPAATVRRAGHQFPSYGSRQSRTGSAV
jgi:hypothetical protein